MFLEEQFASVFERGILKSLSSLNVPRATLPACSPGLDAHSKIVPRGTFSAACHLQGFTPIIEPKPLRALSQVIGMFLIEPSGSEIG
jgi:hypothetical protein